MLHVGAVIPLCRQKKLRLSVLEKLAAVSQLVAGGSQGVGGKDVLVLILAYH